MPEMSPLRKAQLATASVDVATRFATVKYLPFPTLRRTAALHVINKANALWQQRLGVFGAENVLTGAENIQETPERRVWYDYASLTVEAQEQLVVLSGQDTYHLTENRYRRPS